MHKVIFKIGNKTIDLQQKYTCYLRKLQISPAKKRETTVNVPYRNGKLRLKLSEMPVFDSRQAILYMLLDSEDPAEDFERIAQELHGEEARVILDGSSHHYKGFLTMANGKTDKNKFMFQINVDADPYQLKNEVTTKTVTATSAGTIVTLENEQMPTIPTFELSTAAEVTVTLNGTSFTFNEIGIHKSPNIILKQGSNTLTVKGSGQVKISYQEGRL